MTTVLVHSEHTPIAVHVPAQSLRSGANGTKKSPDQVVKPE
ncbi:hypothetical protein [Leptolyngbya sp. NIES-2104]|nr:hypothetical protein [Leptolyngbya sp. NIES-2104]GAP99161.1 hypothetical protein NIES2104_57200 [Leptolyngbya sp. NIES-2104]